MVPTIPPPILPLPHLKQLQDVSSFYFIYVHEAHQSYSLTFIYSFHLPLSLKYPPHYTHCTYFTVLSFIFNSKIACFFDSTGLRGQDSDPSALALGLEPEMAYSTSLKSQHRAVEVQA
jgi:hypothetical protein